MFSSSFCLYFRGGRHDPLHPPSSLHHGGKQTVAACSIFLGLSEEDLCTQKGHSWFCQGSVVRGSGPRRRATDDLILGGVEGRGDGVLFTHINSSSVPRWWHFSAGWWESFWAFRPMSSAEDASLPLLNWSCSFCFSDTQLMGCDPKTSLSLFW